jgi:radical SAM superfamily enzyme YgiQ (UPF0313 family)
MVQESYLIYPVISAQAATLLKEKGYDVIWNDGIAEEKSYEEWLENIIKEKPDIIAIETKTPVIKMHWRIINDLKKLATGNWPLTTVLMGDHVTALPEESMRNSEVDYVLTGGDYDFLLLSLCNYLSFKENHQPKLEPGIWFRENGEIKSTGSFRLDHDLDSLPLIDRDLTKWQLYSEKNGNFKRLPGAYIMAGRDCWYHRCSFCSWTTLFPQFRTRSPERILDEIGFLIEKYGVKEIMDDTGTFPVGDWLHEFCQGMIERGYNKRVYLDCNMRFGALSFEDYKLMKKAGFRLLLFGLESANQKTLDGIKKSLRVEEIIESCRLARLAGLYPHITIMFGYPWEDYEEAKKTLILGRYLLRKGFAHTVQATIIIPYPGTPLFEECKKKGLLRTLKWERYDMKESVIKSPIPDSQLMELVRGIYSVAFNPEFIMRKLLSISGVDDLKFFFRVGLKVIGHLFDFKFHNGAKRIQ